MRQERMEDTVEPQRGGTGIYACVRETCACDVRASGVCECVCPHECGTRLHQDTKKETPALALAPK